MAYTQTGFLGTLDITDAPTWCQETLNKASSSTGSQSVFETNNDSTGYMIGVLTGLQGAFGTADVPRGSSWVV